jgi:hypothetical protein
MRPELVCGAGLHDLARAHDGDAVAERERLCLIVCDVDRRHLQRGEQHSEVDEEAIAQAAVE